MAITDIINTINKNTEEELKKLQQEFEKKKHELKEKYERKQKEIDSALHEKIDEKSKKILEKAENLALQEAQNQLLKTKRQLIEEALDKAVEKLATNSDYEAIITAMLIKSDLQMENMVVIPAKGKEEMTKKAIIASGKKYFLSDQSANINGGFIIKTAKIEIDNSFETIIKRQLKEELEIKINQLLF